MSQSRTCTATPDRLDLAAGRVRWPLGVPITYGGSLVLAQVDGPTCGRLIEAAAFAWASICGIDLRPAAPNTMPNVLVRTGSGPADGFATTNILGETELPVAATKAHLGTVHLVIDADEDWTPEMLGGVLVHEMGHALGLEHSRAPGSVMRPVYDPAVPRPGGDDPAEAQARYGPPNPASPTPTPTPPAAMAITLSAPLPAGTYTLTPRA